MSIVRRMRRRVRGVSAGGGGGTGAFRTGHVGTAILPTAAPPTYTPSNATTGTVHSPTTPAQLRTLLDGGNIGTGVLAAGDTILLARGTCYNDGSHTTQRFKPISGAAANPIRVMSSDIASIAAPTVRRTVAQRASVPHFRAFGNNETPLMLTMNASGYHFIGIEADAGSVSTLYGVVRAGPVPDGAYSAGTTYQQYNVVNGGWVSLQNGNLGNPLVEGAWWTKLDASKLPTNIVFDRCDIAGRLHSNNCVIALYLACRAIVVRDCVLWTEGGNGIEDKAINGSEFAGPMLMENNLVVASAINLLFGGSDPSFYVLPSDLTIRRNHFFKPLRMLANNAAWDGLLRWHKNIFEFKVAMRALVEDNLFENHFDGNQSQFYAIVFKCSNQDGGFPLAETGHVTFRYNRLKNCGGIFGVGTSDSLAGGGTVGCHDFSIYQNYTETPAGVINNTNARNWLVQFAQMPNLFLDANTLVGDTRTDIRTVWMLPGSPAPTGFVFRNMVADWGGEFGGLTSEGFVLVGKDLFTGSGSSAAGNVLYATGVTVPGAKYDTPAQIRVLSAAADVYANRAAGDYRVPAALVGTGADGFTPGADIDTINTRTAGCVTGSW